MRRCPAGNLTEHRDCSAASERREGLLLGLVQVEVDGLAVLVNSRSIR